MNTSGYTLKPDSKVFLAKKILANSSEDVP